MIATLLVRAETLEARVSELEEENARLRKSGTKAVPAWVKPNRPPREEKPRKRRKQAFVRRREAPDVVCEHALEQCPECGRRLTGGGVHRRREVIEIELVWRVVEHVVVARRCGICGKRRWPVLSPAELGVQGKRRFGVGLQSLVGLLNACYRVPMKEIGSFLEEGWGLHVSDGEIVDLLDGVVEAGAPAVEELPQQVQQARVVCGDETGWREDGKNGWLWTFSTPETRYFEIHPTRSGKVPEEVLGEAFRGRLGCDCYVGYNRLLPEKQRCWAHLLRDLDALQQRTGTVRSADRDAGRQGPLCRSQGFPLGAGAPPPPAAPGTGSTAGYSGATGRPTARGAPPCARRAHPPAPAGVVRLR